jgi:Fic family protein
VTGSDFVFSAADCVEQEMQNFAQWLEQASTAMHPVTFAVKVHLNLVSIHPFADGNGRIARLAMNTVLIQHGYLPLLVPPLLRAEYIAAIQKAQTKRNENDFLDFMYRREVESCKEMLRLLKGSKDVPLF